MKKAFEALNVGLEVLGTTLSICLAISVIGLMIASISALNI